jgi:hypothetical protein
LKAEAKKGKKLQKNSAKELAQPAGFSGKLRFVFLFIIIAMSFLAVYKSAGYGFVNYDDDVYVYNNSSIREFGFSSLVSFFTGNVGQYPPSVMVVFSLLYHFFGLDPAAYHSINIIFHLANTLLVFFLVMKLRPGLITATVAALLFGIHPLHVESVAWITELKDVLYTFFFLAGLLSYLAYRNNSAKTRNYVFSLGFFILSCFSKGMAVVFPVILVLIDFYFEKSFLKIKWLNKLPFFVIAAAWGFITVFTQSQIGAVSNENYFLPRSILIVFYGSMFYIVKMFLPVNLSAFYPLPTGTGFSLPLVYYFSFAGIAGLTYLLYRFRKSVVFVFGTLFYLVNLALVLQIIPVGMAVTADRYFYLSSFGLFFIAGAGFEWMYNRYLQQRFIIISASIVISFSLIMLSNHQIAYWKSSISLWDNVLKNASTNHRYSVAFLNRGNARSDTGDMDGAIDDYSKAIGLDSRKAEAYNNRGMILAMRSNFEEAEMDFSKALSIFPDYATAFNNRGNVRRSLGNLSGALDDYSKAIMNKPGYADAYSNRGIVYFLTGDTLSACNDWQNAANLGSVNAKNYLQQYCSTSK